MSSGAKQATPHALLINELLDSRVPKTEREHAAAREIESIRAALVTPPQREWVSLTEEEMKQTCYETFSFDPYVIARAIEAKLKEST